MAFEKLSRFINFQRITMSLAGTFFGILLSVFANWIGAPERLKRSRPRRAVAVSD